MADIVSIIISSRTLTSSVSPLQARNICIFSIIKACDIYSILVFFWHGFLMKNKEKKYSKIMVNNVDQNDIAFMGMI